MKIQFPLYAKLTIILFGTILLFFIMKMGSPILIPITFSFLLALLLLPLCSWFEARRVPRGLAVLMSILTMVIFMGAIFYLIFNQLTSFSEDIPVFTERIGGLIADLTVFLRERFSIEPGSQMDWLGGGLQKVLQKVGSVLGGVLSTTAGFFTQVAIIPIYIFFILYYRNLFSEFISKSTTADNKERVNSIVGEIKKIVQGYLLGQLTVMLILVVLNTTALLIIGVKHAVFFGALAALLNIIPYIGVFIGSMLPTLYSLAMSDSLWTPVIVFASFSVIQTFESNVLTPNIVGSRVSINPFVSILTIFVGAYIWGIAGMVLFIPLVAIVKAIIDHIEELKPWGILLGMPEKPDKEKKKWLGRITSRKKKIGLPE